MKKFNQETNLWAFISVTNVPMNESLEIVENKYQPPGYVIDPIRRSTDRYTTITGSG